jgi:hypothetical protein
MPAPPYSDATTFAAQDVINWAASDCNIKDAAETLSGPNDLDMLRILNNMISGWGTQTLTMPFISRNVFAFIAFQATYSIGPGGDFNTTTRPIGLTGAGVLLNTSNPPIEIPRSLFTDDGYEAISIKALQNLFPTGVYYNPTYTAQLGTIFVWPTPTDATSYSLVLYRKEQVQQFADLVTQYNFPPGYLEAFEWNLARRLLTPYGIKDPTIRQDVTNMAVSSLAAIKRANYRMSDLSLDPAFVNDRRAGYNILTGQ